jgi:predicted phage baseplate assembly protein
VSESAFVDETNAFTKTGSISFNCPPDISPTEIEEETGYWIRVRIISGDYGRETTTIRPPAIKTILLKFSQELRTPQHCLTYNDFTFRDINREMREKEITSFQPFEIDPELSPAFYVGFDRRFSNKLHRIYFWVVEEPAEMNQQRKESEAEHPVVVWEYWSEEKKGWVNLNLHADNTRSFTHAGDIEFVGPADFGETEVFRAKAYWFRAKWEIGKYRYSPMLRGINLNSVSVIQGKSLRDEILGSSNGSPNQVFSFSQAPILPDVEILVEEEGPTGEGWYQVADFFESKEDSRHYILDCQAGKVYFGDGRRGMIPPAGRNNTRCSWYRVGGGAVGNVGSGAITLVKSSIPYVESIINLDAAGGGADPETVEEARQRGPRTLKHRYRAVTRDDFEALAKEASNNVARVRCLPTEEKEGEVTVIIVPKSQEDRPSPSTELLWKVRDYLDQRRLITTRLRIVKPSYTKVSMRIDVVIETPERSSELKKKMMEELRSFLHPLRGGPKREGWEFGRDVYISEIYELIEGIKGVDHVATLVLSDNPRLHKVTVPDNSLVYPGEVIINIVSG